MKQEKERLDLIFGLGYACGCSTTLRKVGLQFISLPFDWIGLVGLDVQAGLVERHFEGWLKEENMVKLSYVPGSAHERYIDKATGLNYWHDFAMGKALADELPAVRAKYDRRIARFERLVGESRKILIVWISDCREKTPPSEKEIRHCLDVFNRRWPGRDFRMLVFKYASGVPAESAQVVKGEHFEIVSFDLQSHENGAEDWMLDTAGLYRFLGRYEVRDYRTAAERKSYEKQQLQREMKRYGTHSMWTYQVRKFEFKLYKHLKKHLERQGVALH